MKNQSRPKPRPCPNESIDVDRLNRSKTNRFRSPTDRFGPPCASFIQSNKRTREAAPRLLLLLKLLGFVWRVFPSCRENRFSFASSSACMGASRPEPGSSSGAKQASIHATDWRRPEGLAFDPCDSPPLSLTLGPSLSTDQTASEGEWWLVSQQQAGGNQQGTTDPRHRRDPRPFPFLPSSPLAWVRPSPLPSPTRRMSKKNELTVVTGEAHQPSGPVVPGLVTVRGRWWWWYMHGSAGRHA